MRKSSLVVAAVLFLSVLFAGMSLLPEARATTLYVGGAGPGNHTTIQVPAYSLITISVEGE